MKWEMKWCSGRQLRQAIDDGSHEKIRKAMVHCYEEIGDNMKDLSGFCDNMIEDIEERFLDDDLDDTDVDWMLEALYDFCDENSIWLEL